MSSRFLHDEAYRRMIATRLNAQEARHSLARRIFFGQRGELRQGYREGMGDQLGALGLALNVVVLWNTFYLDAAVKHLRVHGEIEMTNDIAAHLSPLGSDHIHFLGRYSFSPTHASGLKPLRDPAGSDEHVV